MALLLILYCIVAIDLKNMGPNNNGQRHLPCRVQCLKKAGKTLGKMFQWKQQNIVYACMQKETLDDNYNEKAKHKK